MGQVNKDDITQKLVVHEAGDDSAFFAVELQKHDSSVALLRQNLGAQKNITKALTEANAQYASTQQALMEKVSSQDALANLKESCYGSDLLLLLVLWRQRGVVPFQAFSPNTPVIVGRLEEQRQGGILCQAFTLTRFSELWEASRKLKEGVY